LSQTLSRLADEYDKAVDLLFDMTAMRSATAMEKQEEKTNQLLSDLELYTETVMDRMEAVWSVYAEMENLLERLESHEITILRNLNNTVAQANESIHQMTTHMELKLKAAYQELNIFSSSWLTFALNQIQNTLSLSTGGATLVLFSMVTPVTILLQGLRSEFIWSMLCAVWLAAWLQLSSNFQACILVYIFLHVGVVSLAEALVWLWTAQMLAQFNFR